MKTRIRSFTDGDGFICERILRSLPDWFGIEEAIVSYCRDIATMETIVAELDGDVAGFLTIRRHNPFSAEIQVMGVLPSHHGKGVGRAMVEHAEALLREQQVEFFQVKTLGPSRKSEHYDRTRGFYERMGFKPLEENDMWGEENPCLIMVKHLVCLGKVWAIS